MSATTQGMIVLAATLLILFSGVPVAFGLGEKTGHLNRKGREGASIDVATPVGTIVYDWPSGEVLHDFTTPGDRFVVAKGGRGGKGWKNFRGGGGEE